jgi:hypothetical protein
VSDYYIKLIPTGPIYVPDAEARRRAEAQLAAFLPETPSVPMRVSSRVTAEVAFVDPGGNFERVRCPQCGAELDLAWWGAAMDAAFETRFRALSVTLPCCGATRSLNDLRYEFPAGFARFVLQAENPNSFGLGAEQVQAIEHIVRSPLRQIWVLR